MNQMTRLCEATASQAKSEFSAKGALSLQAWGDAPGFVK
jgi:hypothetical protein